MKKKRTAKRKSSVRSAPQTLTVGSGYNGPYNTGDIIWYEANTSFWRRFFNWLKAI